MLTPEGTSKSAELSGEEEGTEEEEQSEEENFVGSEAVEETPTPVKLHVQMEEWMQNIPDEGCDDDSEADLETKAADDLANTDALKDRTVNNFL